MIDPVLDAISKESQRPFESQLGDYEAKLRAVPRSESHIADTLRYNRKIASASNWNTVADISADGVNRFAKGLQEQNKSARTVQAYVTAVKSFSNWLAQLGKLPRDPLASVGRPTRRLIVV